MINKKLIFFIYCILFFFTKSLLYANTIATVDISKILEINNQYKSYLDKLFLKKKLIDTLILEREEFLLDKKKNI